MVMMMMVMVMMADIFFFMNLGMIEPQTVGSGPPVPLLITPAEALTVGNNDVDDDDDVDDFDDYDDGDDDKNVSVLMRF